MTAPIVATPELEAAARHWWNNWLSINQQRAWFAAECDQYEEEGFYYVLYRRTQLMVRMHTAFLNRWNANSEYFRLAYIEYVRRHNFRIGFMDQQTFTYIMLQSEPSNLTNDPGLLMLDYLIYVQRFKNVEPLMVRTYQEFTYWRASGVQFV